MSDSSPPIDYERYIGREEAQSAPARELGPLEAELALLRGAPGATLDGTVARLKQYYEHPTDALVPAGTGFAIGVLLSACATRAKVAPAYATIVKYFGRYGVATACTDAAIRIGVPVVNTWNDPGSVQRQTDVLGSNVGNMMVDFSLMGLSGYAGGRAYMRGMGLAPGAPTTLRYSDEIGEALATNFQRPKSYEPFVVRDDKLYRFAWKEAPPGLVLPEGELHEAAASIERAYNIFGSRRGLPPVTAQYDGELAALAGASPHEPKVAFNGVVLSTGNKLDVINMATHELTHIDQNVALARYYADSLGIGKKANPTQLAQLREVLLTKSGIKPSDAGLEALLQVRDGQPLSLGQKWRVERMLTDAPFEQRVHAQLWDGMNTVRDLDHFKGLVKTPEGIANLRQILREPGQYSVAVGNLSMPAEIQMWKNGTTVPSTQSPHFPETQTMLSNWLQSEHRVAFDRLLHLRFNDYANVYVEKEAFRAGAAAVWNHVSTNPRNALLLGLGQAATADGAWWLGANLADKPRK